MFLIFIHTYIRIPILPRISNNDFNPRATAYYIIFNDHLHLPLPELNISGQAAIMDFMAITC